MSEKEQCLTLLNGMSQQNITTAAVVLEYLVNGAEIRLTVPVNSVRIDGKIHDLKNPIFASLTLGESCFMEYEPYGIFEVCDTFAEVKAAFDETLEFLYREYAFESDDAMTQDAIELKMKLLENIG